MKNTLTVVFVWILYSLSLVGQTQLKSPTIVQVSNLSTDLNNDGQYVIIWINNELTIPVDNYVIYKYEKWNDIDNIPVYNPIDTVVNDKSNRYIFNPSEELEKVVYYAVEALSLNPAYEPSSDNISRIPMDNAPSNIYLSLQFDSCLYKFTLKWNSFLGWSSPTNYFKIEFSVNNGAKSNINFKGDLFTSADSLVLPDIASVSNFKEIDDSTYYFRVISASIDGYQCTSNAVSSSPNVLKVPSFINADGTKVIGDNQIEIYFSIDPINELDKFVVYKSDKGQDEFKEIDTIIINSSSIIYKDTNVIHLASKEDINRYFYYATLLNTCNEPLEDIKSNMTSNIPLTLLEDGNFNKLSWDAHRDFRGTVNEYVVYRVRGGNNEESIGSTLGTSYNDDLNNLTAKKINEEICYYVDAVEKDNPNNINGHAWSNRTCMNLKAKVDMPKFIVLGKDCSSKAEKPFQFPADVFTPSSFQMIIFDRWGTNIFETSISTEGWDGTYRNGSIVPVGAYMYYIKFSGNDNKPTEQKDTFVVLCP